MKIVRRRRASSGDLFEQAARSSGRMCGADEAGCGPLAGPVVAAAVILDPSRQIRGLRDSKQLPAAVREKLAQVIRERAIAWYVAVACVEEIDAINILQARLLAMRRAIEALDPCAHYALIDGNQLPVLGLPARAIVSGDIVEPAISAASILAKTVRDSIMREHDEKFPGYGFARHMGYPTPEHLERLRELGPCEIHRRSFAPVRDWRAARPILENADADADQLG